jgi:hypothetical protein
MSSVFYFIFHRLKGINQFLCKYTDQLNKHRFDSFPHINTSLKYVRTNLHRHYFSSFSSRLSDHDEAKKINHTTCASIPLLSCIYTADYIAFRFHPPTI